MYTGCASCHPFESNGSKSRPRVLYRGINKAWTEREREKGGGRVKKGKKREGKKEATSLFSLALFQDWNWRASKPTFLSSVQLLTGLKADERK